MLLVPGWPFLTLKTYLNQLFASFWPHLGPKVSVCVFFIAFLFVSEIVQKRKFVAVQSFKIGFRLDRVWMT